MRPPPRIALLAVGVIAAAVGLAVARGEWEVPADRPVAAAPRPAPSRTPLLPHADRAPQPTSAGLAAALAGGLTDRALGSTLSVSVVDAGTGATLLDIAGQAAVLPASTVKIATAVAVLTGLPPDTRLTTRALAGPLPGDVVLVGGGDVTLAGPRAAPTSPPAARLVDLADQVRVALAGVPVRRVLVDDTAFTGPTTGPGWRPGYVGAGDVAPVSALSVDGGRADPAKPARVADPALAAGAGLAALLAPTAVVARGTAAPGSAALGAVSSPPVAQLVEAMLTRSDNDLAESLARRLAVVHGRQASFTGAAAAVQATLGPMSPAGTFALVDGSGLSRQDRVRPAGVTALLVLAARGDDGLLSPVLTGLPVAGFDGTLADRFRAGPAAPAAGQVRAKTGTLEGVSALAGLVRTAEGRLLAFDVTADAVPVGGTLAAEAALDRLAATLASCGCR